MANEKSFTFKIISQKAYTLVFTGVTIVNTIIWALKPKIRIVFSSSATVKVAYSLAMRNAISYVVKLYGNLPITMRSGSNVITYVMKQIMKITLAIASSTAGTYVLKQTMKVINLFAASNSISYTAILAQFHALSVYDPQTLSALDSQTLGDLDYTAV